MSSARPRTTPAGESHSTRAQGSDGASRRQALRITSNLPARRSPYRSAIAARISASSHRAIGRPARFRLDRGHARRQLRRIRSRLKIDPKAKDGELHRSRLRRRLRKNASQLAAADQDVVRPLDLRGQTGVGPHGFCNGDSAGERQQRGRINVVRVTSLTGRRTTETYSPAPGGENHERP